LVFVLAVSVLIVIFAEFGLVLCFYLVLGVSELACVSFLALVLEEVSTDAFSLQSEELLHIGLVTDVD
jgi:hypothetical protein